MEMTQSVIFSLCRVKLSKYEQRILSKIVEYTQISLRGEAPRLVKKQVQHKDPNCRVRIPVKFILDEESDHYNHVYEAVRSLMARRLEYRDPEQKKWFATPMVYNATCGGGVLDFYVSQKLCEVILDFRAGWKGYDLGVALSLGSPAAVRFYVLMSRQNSPLTFTIEELKEMFGVSDKYKQTADFIKKVIEPARVQLEEAKVIGFTFVRNYEGQKVISLTFFPLAPSDQVKAIGSAETASTIQKIRLYMATYIGFTNREILVLSKIIQTFAHVPDACNQLQHIEHISHRKKDPKAYIVGAMKKEISALTKKQKNAPAYTEER